MNRESRPSTSTHAIVAGVVTAVVGFTSSFAVVLTGLDAVGASADEAASALFVLSVTMGVGTIAFSWRLRRPVTMAWSTPGAALLAGAVAPEGGYATAVGAFVVAGVLYALTGLFTPLARLVRAIPLALANAMLAGVLLGLCVQPFRALVDEPAAVAPVLLTWLLLLRVARRWAVPGAFAAAVVVIVVTGSLAAVDSADIAPRLTWTAPGFDLATMLAIGLPLYLVTMTSQNIPGAAVLASFGYDAPMRPALFYAGGATVATAGLGGYSINLAAISAALAAGPEAHPDPARRWVAGVSAGTTYLAFGPLAAAVAAVTVAAPTGLVAAVAGVALIGTFASAATSALGDPGHRDAAAITFVVAASGVVAFGVGAAFWSLLAGGLYLLVMRRPVQA
ncbi:benzoate membrane transport protein [Nocardioides szechwanensis]|uniref:Benzoate membrane transport protein n=1 Tax=Nocardioides szechwanensis TaxID=1005944 RepID=A0A1H0KY75_9ACTN|nr:benzoate/H(+) symporter BenE family transporter [Nocardioides szechwanensis]SDO60898.1 benzoate membrane transport protein [Nocardioides szechwanensis]